MSDRTSGASPATQFHDVVVTHEQTREQWRAARAEIRNGRICVAGTPPEGFLDRRGSTFTITATDRIERARTFPHLTIAEMGPAGVLFT